MISPATCLTGVLLATTFASIRSAAQAPMMWERDYLTTSSEISYMRANSHLEQWDGQHAFLYTILPHQELLTRLHKEERFPWNVKAVVLDSTTGRIVRQGTMKAKSRRSEVRLAGNLILQCDQGKLRFYSREFVELFEPVSYSPIEEVIRFSDGREMAGVDHLEVSPDHSLSAILSYNQITSKIILISLTNRVVVAEITTPKIEGTRFRLYNDRFSVQAFGAKEKYFHFDGSVAESVEKSISNVTNIELPRLSMDEAYRGDPSVSSQDGWGASVFCRYRHRGLFDTTDSLLGCAVLVVEINGKETRTIDLPASWTKPVLTIFPNRVLVVASQTFARAYKVSK